MISSNGEKSIASISQPLSQGVVRAVASEMSSTRTIHCVWTVARCVCEGYACAWNVSGEIVLISRRLYVVVIARTRLGAGRAASSVQRLSQCCKCFTPMDHASDRSAPVSAESALEAELEYLLENTDADMKERERRSRIRELRRQLFGDAKSTGSGGSAERRCNVVADVVSEGPDEESAPARGGAPGPDAEEDCEAMDSGE